MFSGLPRQSGSRVTGEAITALTTSSGGSSAFKRDHVGAVDHHVGDHQLAQIEHAAEHVAVARLHAAFDCAAGRRRRASSSRADSTC